MVNKWKHAFMETANIFGKLSHAKRAQVGAAIVKDNRIISVGYNGMPAGWDNTCEDNNVTKPEVLHAETNAIAKVARSAESCEGADIYTTYAPCIDCAKLIYQSGINKVYYANDHMRSTAGVDFLHKCDIEVTHVPI